MDLRANTQIIVPMGIFVNPADAVTPEEGVTLTNAATSEASIIKHGSITPVTIDTNAFVHMGNDARGHYGLTLTAANLDTYGNLRVVITNDALHLPVWKDFQVVNEFVWDEKYSNKNTADNFQASVARIIQGQAQTGQLTPTTMTTDLGSGYGDLSGRTVIWLGNVQPGIRESQRPILNNDTSTGQITWADALPFAPGNGDQFIIV